MATIMILQPEQLSNCFASKAIIEELWCGGSICYLRLHLNTKINIKRLRQQQFKLLLKADDQNVKLWFGILESVQLQQSEQANCYIIKLISWFDTLKLCSESRVWNKLSALDILRIVCNEHGYFDIIP